MGSSSAEKVWPGHVEADGGQRGESKGAQHCTDASPTTMSHFRPLWFGLGGAGRQRAGALSPHRLLLLFISFFHLLLFSLFLISLRRPFLSVHPGDFFSLPSFTLKHLDGLCGRVVAAHTRREDGRGGGGRI